VKESFRRNTPVGDERIRIDWRDWRWASGGEMFSPTHPGDLAGRISFDDAVREGKKLMGR
jgi:hypothetical protein